jgi:hypothetical protein
LREGGGGEKQRGGGELRDGSQSRSHGCLQGKAFVPSLY